MDAARNDLWDALGRLWEVPGVLLSSKGVSQGAGFALLAYIRQMVHPPARDFLRTLPGSQLTEPILNGMWTNANMIYGINGHR